MGDVCCWSLLPLEGSRTESKLNNEMKSFPPYHKEASGNNMIKNQDQDVGLSSIYSFKGSCQGPTRSRAL